MAEDQSPPSGAADTPDSLPEHVAIIMDGNGRWAESRGKARHAGHRAGYETVRSVVEETRRLGISTLTLFAFSSENWQRPVNEVNLLMSLFINALEREAKRLLDNNVRLQVIGEMAAFSDKLQQRIVEAQGLTAQCDGMRLQIAANYGGRWDITRAAQRLARRVQQGQLRPEEIDEDLFAGELALAGLPDPDLFIRTGGERRISNFLIWQCAYTELYFTDVLWPDFDVTDYRKALQAFASRERRFGRTGAQVFDDRDALDGGC